ncbi:hypothetical protein DBR40_05410 [Pedobacter sp. KBW01]|uniref:hypothetical protein n=1 Tax=Pedobacter sp. KBW01 TaxID=2153364 RepID=UPI000F5A3A22|nr:hypothetical protein [Pedobacter sp. KBW01]RQO79157.1 hypothetical protein DBR40_05410 [Pedobacter sp. KBW01]
MFNKKFAPVTIAIGFITIILLSYGIYQNYKSAEPMGKTDIIYFLVIPTLLVLVFMGVFNFLRGSDDRNSVSRSLSDEIKMSSEDLFFLKSEFASLKSSLIDPEKIKKDAESIFYSKINELTSESIVTKVYEEFKKDAIINNKVKIIERELDDLKHRIRYQSQRLARSTALNLTIGVTTTAAVIAFLGYSVATFDTTLTSAGDYLIHFIPRISLSIILEVFAYFFLRLYTKNLEEIKYWNNELTNIEFKSIAIKSAMLEDNTKLLEKIAMEILKTERNFILKKGESTVELEKSKNDETNTLAIISKLAGIKDSVKKKTV